jgi:hypothetical protein
MELITAPYFLQSGILAFALTGLIYFFLTDLILNNSEHGSGIVFH